MMSSTLTKTSTTEMEVTSIRLERELKDRLKALAGHQGYQALVREVLWHYVHQNSEDFQPQVARNQIRVSIEATAQKEERCALTGQRIRSQEPMILGWTNDGRWVPLSATSL